MTSFELGSCPCDWQDFHHGEYLQEYQNDLKEKVWVSKGSSIEVGDALVRVSGYVVDVEVSRLSGRGGRAVSPLSSTHRSFHLAMIRRSHLGISSSTGSLKSCLSASLSYLLIS